MRRRYRGEEAERGAADGERRLDQTAPAYQSSIPPGITYLARHMRPFDVSSYGSISNSSKFPSRAGRLQFEKRARLAFVSTKRGLFLSQDFILHLSFN